MLFLVSCESPSSPKTYTLTFEVKPTTAKVELKKNDANGDPITGSNNIFSDLNAGKYHYSVSANGYDTKTGTVEITDKDLSPKVDLTLITYTLTFNVMPTDSKVILKENDASGDPITGSNNVFSSLPPGTYYYSASKTGYDTETGMVEITNANVTKDISLFPPFVSSLSVDATKTVKAYHWVYFETEADGSIPFEGTLYFLLKEAGKTPPTATEIKTHPNRMNRSVSVTEEEATQGTTKTLTKNFTGLSGDAVVNANYEFEGTPPYHEYAGRLEGVGHVLADGATYTVWVLPVASDATGKESDIFSLGEITAGRKADVQAVSEIDHYDMSLGKIFTKQGESVDVDDMSGVSDFEVQIAQDERLMLPWTIKRTTLLSSYYNYWEVTYNQKRIYYSTPSSTLDISRQQLYFNTITEGINNNVYTQIAVDPPATGSLSKLFASNFTTSSRDLIENYFIVSLNEVNTQNIQSRSDGQTPLIYYLSVTVVD